MTKRQLRTQRQPEPERALADYTDTELSDGITAALGVAHPGTKEGWPAIKRAGELIREKSKRRGNA